MRDGQNREIRYIRVSVTDRCNLRCVYCMPPQGVEWLPHENILTYEEIGRICRILAEMGVDTVRLTGGEPLVRRGLEELVALLKATPGIRRVNLTTNGLLLARQLPALLSAGLDGVNISLDTLDQGQFAALTRRGDLFRVDQVLQGLEAALAAPGLEVKLNCVPMGYNDDQLVPLALLARERPLAVRFIEMMPIGLGAHMEGRSEAWVRARLEEVLGPLTPWEGEAGSGPARYVTAPGFAGRLGFISAVSHQFCQSCNRVRLTASGFFKTCLQYDRGVELRPLLSGPDGALQAAMAAALAQKPAGHCFAQREVEGGEGRIMNQIGG